MGTVPQRGIEHAAARRNAWLPRCVCGALRWASLSTRQQVLSFALTAAVAAVPLIQCALLLWSIWAKTLHVPFWDEYKMAVLVQKWDTRTLSVGDLWAFHNEHRPFWPRLVQLILIEQTHWNRQIEMSVNLLVGVATALLIFSAVATSLRSRRLWLPLLVPVSLLVLSLDQFENWYWSWQLTFIGSAFGAAICLRACVGASPREWSWRRFGVAVLGAFVVSLASAAGLLLWVGFLPAIWFAGRSKVAVWLVTGAAYWIIYFQGFQRTFQAPQPLLKMLVYAGIWLGAPLAAHVAGLALLLGYLGLFLFGILLYFHWKARRSLAPLAAWISLALYTLGMAAVTAYGRTATGLIEAMSSRYQAFSALFWVALLVIGAATARDVWLVRTATESDRPRAPGWTWALQWMRNVPQESRALVGLLLVTCAMVTASLVQTNRVGLMVGLDWQARLLRRESCILHYREASPACFVVFDDMTVPAEARTFRRALEIMERERLNVFYDPRARSSFP
jgi:hypothetical protein